MHETKCRLFGPQVSGRSLCLSLSYTLFGGLGSPWVETSWCWRVEEATHCLLCTSTEEEPGSSLGPCTVTSSWTSKYHPPNSGSSLCVIVTLSALEVIPWQFQTELFLSLLTNHMSGEKHHMVSCCYHQVTGWRAALPRLPTWLRCSLSVLWQAAAPWWWRLGSCFGN